MHRLRLIAALAATTAVVLGTTGCESDAVKYNEHDGGQQFARYDRWDRGGNGDENQKYSADRWGVRGKVTAVSGPVGAAGATLTVAYIDEFHYGSHHGTARVSVAAIPQPQCLFDGKDTIASDLHVGTQVEVYGTTTDKATATDLLLADCHECANRAASVYARQEQERIRDSSIVPDNTAIGITG